MRQRRAQDFICTADFPVVRTAQGKIRGFQTRGIYTFHGIKYADARRFHRPEPVKAVGRDPGRPFLRVCLPAFNPGYAQLRGADPAPVLAHG